MFEIIQLDRDLRSLDLLIKLIFIRKFINRLLNGLLVEVDQTHVFLEVFQLLINTCLFHSKAVIVPQFGVCPLSLDLVDEFLKVRVYKLDVLDSSDFHLFVQIVTHFNELFSLV